MQKIRVSAPSNIALIKYMGKSNAADNRPANSSLSLTLPHLKSWVEIEALSDLAADRSGDRSVNDQWAALDGFAPVELSPFSIKRFLDHAQFLKKELGIRENFTIRSANDFPSDCGLASSASSFAALTKAFVQWAKDHGQKTVSEEEASKLSRKGSGSSCRSFFPQWAVWSGEGAHALALPSQAWIHQVVIVQSGKKEVSSSDAHRRVVSSDLYQGRPERAEKRFQALLQAMKKLDWKSMFDICWIEFQDMHSLFETSSPPFGYFEPKSLEVLKVVREIWKAQNDGPIVTMDAGPNIHLIWRPEQELQARVFESTWKVRHRIISGQDFAVK